MSVQMAVAIRGYISARVYPLAEHPPDVRSVTTKTQGWREAEALANEGCAATLDTNPRSPRRRACEMLQYHGRDARRAKCSWTPRGPDTGGTQRVPRTRQPGPGRPVNIGDRVITPDGPGIVKDTRREKDILHGGRVLHGRLFLWVQLDKRNGLELYTGKQVQPE